jgi:hypothetical protein
MLLVYKLMSVYAVHTFNRPIARSCQSYIHQSLIVFLQLCISHTYTYVIYVSIDLQA